MKFSTKVGIYIGLTFVIWAALIALVSYGLSTFIHCMDLSGDVWHCLNDLP